MIFLLCSISLNTQSQHENEQSTEEQIIVTDDTETISFHDQHEVSPNGDNTAKHEEITSPEIEEEVVEYYDPRGRIIKDIIIEGNAHVPSDALLDRIPYKIGEAFDVRKTRTAILRLYHDLKRFSKIDIYGENVGDNELILHIKVTEKPVLKEVIYEGNSQVSTSEIEKQVLLKDLPAIEEAELKAYAQKIKKIYLEKGYFLTEISSRLEFDSYGYATAIFTAHEKKRSLIKRILFKGNEHISSKELRNIMYSREDWIMSVLDKAGHYMPDRVELGDRQVIEQHYKNRGYINAKVVDIQTIIDPDSGHLNLEFEIKEGDQYTIKSVRAVGNDILTEEYLTAVLPIRSGNTYSQEGMMNAIKTLEFVWGDLGYIYAHIEPAIIPNDDDKTVSITFNSDIGSKVFLNKIIIRGNKKSRDKIIRRNIILEEGDVITNARMESSKHRVEGLGYFEQREGVNWKINRLDENLADLELILKETKTGNAHLKLGFGGAAASLKSPISSVSLEGNISDSNLFGSGIRMNINGRLGKEEKTIVFNLTNPWMFDKPIFGAIDVFHRRVSYDELRFIPPVTQKYSGLFATTGLMFAHRNYLFNDTYLRIATGLEHIKNERPIPPATIPSLFGPDRLLAEKSYHDLCVKQFSDGDLALFSVHLGQDKKNHPMHPSRGHSWVVKSSFGFSAISGNIGYHKFDIETNWFTPLIAEIDLVYRLHTYMGIVTQLGNHIIPYRELYHIGGPASVRGFLYGQIGPQFSVGYGQNTRSASIGGSKAFFLNSELLFPITPDFSMKGILFYDGGAGWDNPNSCEVPQAYLKNNSFTYRHSIGVGLRILNPVPVRIDWGFKLDARKGETAHELHFGMSYDW